MANASCVTTMRRARAIIGMWAILRSRTGSPIPTRCWQVSGAMSKTGDDDMRTVTLEVVELDDVKRRARDAFAGKNQGSRISFAKPELLFKLLTAKRWDLIRAIAGAESLTIRGVARRVKRDVKAVHGDVRALLDAGILQKTK